MNLKEYFQKFKEEILVRVSYFLFQMDLTKSSWYLTIFIEEEKNLSSMKIIDYITQKVFYYERESQNSQLLVKQIVKKFKVRVNIMLTEAIIIINIGQEQFQYQTTKEFLLQTIIPTLISNNGTISSHQVKELLPSYISQDKYIKIYAEKYDVKQKESKESQGIIFQQAYKIRYSGKLINFGYHKQVLLDTDYHFEEDSQRENTFIGKKQDEWIDSKKQNKQFASINVKRSSIDLKQYSYSAQKYKQSNQGKRIQKNNMIAEDDNLNSYFSDDSDESLEDGFPNILNTNKKGIFKNDLKHFVNQYYLQKIQHQEQQNQKHKKIINSQQNQITNYFWKEKK
ncbi:hypothetical protein ABPG72_012323 [Tetrahymena utriculariae]